jgi:cytochrome c biogenesis protein CcdA
LGVKRATNSFRETYTTNLPSRFTCSEQTEGDRFSEDKSGRDDFEPAPEFVANRARFAIHLDAKPAPVGLWGAYIMGFAFAFGWTACIGPILAAILSIAAAEATVTKGAGLLAVYSAGLGIPFLIAALMIEQFPQLFARMKGHLVNVERAMGVLMVITGIGFLTGAVSNASIWLLETFPALQTIG